LIEYLHLAYFARPTSERVLYRSIRKLRPHQIVVLGLGDGSIPGRIIRTAARFAEDRPIQFTGIDLFEMRPPEAGTLALRDAHRILRPLGATVRLVPGDPLAALASESNSLLNTDLVIIHGDQDRAALTSAWFYVPRMLHPGSTVLLQEPGSEDYHAVDLARIEHWASNSLRARKAA
jgi:hypothetical protein